LVCFLAALASCDKDGDEADKSAAPDPVRPNILVVVLDDVGTDLIDSYHEHPDAVTLPVIDGLAQRGVSFDAAWVEPLCSPTRAALLTGLHPGENGIGTVVGGSSALSTSWFTTLPREAKKDGYYTFAVGKWHLAGFLLNDLDHPNEIGFDYFAGSMDNLRANGTDYFDWTKVVNGVATEHHDVYATTDTADEAIAQIQEHRDQPWLGWVAFHSAHTPRHQPPEGLTYSSATLEPDPPELTRLMLEALDIELGRVLDRLPDKPTTVIVIGDNGTSELAQTPPLVPGHSKGSVYEPGIRVPLIVQGYGVAAAAEGRRSDALVQAPDLLATLTDLFRETPLESISSTSFEGCLRDPEGCTHRDIVYAERFTPNNPAPGEVTAHRQAAREHRYKLIIQDSGDEELYDLLADPDEIENLLTGPLTVEQEDAYLRLRAELLALRLVGGAGSAAVGLERDPAPTSDPDLEPWQQPLLDDARLAGWAGEGEASFSLEPGRGMRGPEVIVHATAPPARPGPSADRIDSAGDVPGTPEAEPSPMQRRSTIAGRAGGAIAIVMSLATLVLWHAPVPTGRRRQSRGV
jgi:arylsulfatase A-like enzyme